MPVSKSDKKNKKAQRASEKTYVRLARSGARGENGLARYYNAKLGRLYLRNKLYFVASDVLDFLMQTGHFEIIHPSELARAKEDADKPRGASLSARARIRRRQAASKRVADNPDEVGFEPREDPSQLLDSASDLNVSGMDLDDAEEDGLEEHTI